MPSQTLRSNGSAYGTSPDGQEHPNSSSSTSPGGLSTGGFPTSTIQPMRNPRGPAGESRGFGSGAPGTLRTSVSHGVMRGGSGFSAGGQLGGRAKVVDEDEAGEILALTSGIDALRTKDSLDL